MSRRATAATHSDSGPGNGDRQESEQGARLLEALIAFHHPTRRWLCELLGTEGPATVGQLAERTGLAVGSVSHHIKALHRHGFVQPAPELARDSRQSWWRIAPRRLSWSPDDYAADTLGRRVADAAEAENLRYQLRAMQQWTTAAASAPAEWRGAAEWTDSLVTATVDQLADLGTRLSAVLDEWTTECRHDQQARPDAERRPVRTIVRTFPSGPVKP